MKKLKLLFVISLSTCAIIFGIYLFLEQQKVNDLNNKLEEALNKDAGFTETILKIESESSGMSYKELFDLCEQSVIQRTDLIVHLRGLYPEINSQLKDSLVEFLTVENELVRNKSRVYRASMNYNSNMEDWEENHRDWNISDYYLSSYYSNRSTKLIEEMSDNIIESEDSNIKHWLSYGRLILKEKVIANLMKVNDLRHVQIYKKHFKSNESFFHETNTLDSLRRKKLGI